MNHHVKDYIHFSVPHRIQSRIEQIFLQSTAIPTVVSSKIQDTSLSDHSIVTLNLNYSSRVKGPFKWHLNEAPLSNPVHCTMLEGTLREYFTENAHKMVVRGKLIQISSHLKREQNAEIQMMSEEFLLLSKNNPTTDNLTRLDAARIKLNLALATSAEKHLKWTGARFYTQKDKVGSKLAARISPKIRTVSFPKICTKTGDLTQNPLKVMDAFHVFYSRLYNDKLPDKPSRMETFLCNIPLTKITRMHRELH